MGWEKLTKAQTDLKIGRNFDLIKSQCSMFQHYIDLDLSKYEASLYTNVEELVASISMSEAVSLEPGKMQVGAKNDFSDVKEDSRL